MRYGMSCTICSSSCCSVCNPGIHGGNCLRQGCAYSHVNTSCVSDSFPTVDNVPWENAAMCDILRLSYQQDGCLSPDGDGLGCACDGFSYCDEEKGCDSQGPCLGTCRSSWVPVLFFTAAGLMCLCFAKVVHSQQREPSWRANQQRDASSSANSTIQPITQANSEVVSVHVPPGATPGTAILVHTVAGQAIQVIVPAGVSPGSMLQVTVPIQQIVVNAIPVQGPIDTITNNFVTPAVPVQTPVLPTPQVAPSPVVPVSGQPRASTSGP